MATTIYVETHIGIEEESALFQSLIERLICMIRRSVIPTHV